MAQYVKLLPIRLNILPPSTGCWMSKKLTINELVGSFVDFLFSAFFYFCGTYSILIHSRWTHVSHSNLHLFQVCFLHSIWTGVSHSAVEIIYWKCYWSTILNRELYTTHFYINWWQVLFLFNSGQDFKDNWLQASYSVWY